MRGPRGGASEGGFTLVELMVVVGIAAILLSVFTLGVRRASESFALRQAGAMSAVEVRNAQAGAVSNGVDYTVEFDTSGAGGPPGSILVFRPGQAMVGTLSVTSTGAQDTRSLTIVGITNNVLVSETFFLNGTAVQTESVPGRFDWILEAETPTPNSCCTISIRDDGTQVATIAASTAAATLPWTQLRAISTPEWPQQVRMDSAGTTLPLCSSYGGPWAASTNHCLRFRPLGFPDQAGAVLLCNRARSPVRIVIAAGTGRVGTDRAGACP